MQGGGQQQGLDRGAAWEDLAKAAHLDCRQQTGQFPATRTCELLLISCAYRLKMECKKEQLEQELLRNKRLSVQSTERRSNRKQ